MAEHFVSAGTHAPHSDQTFGPTPTRGGALRSALALPRFPVLLHSGQIQLSLKNSARSDLELPVLPETQKGTTINTDEWGAYRHLSAAERQHVTVCHAPEKRV